MNPASAEATVMLAARDGGACEAACLRLLRLDEAPQVLTLQDVALGALMFPLSAAEIHTLLAGGQGGILGAFVGDELVAFLAITLPGLGEHNLGRDAGLPPEQWAGVAQWTAVVVHPRLRGRGLQRRLLQHCLEHMAWPGVRRWLATVRCDNGHSLRNFQAAGAHPIARIRKYDGHERFVVMLALPEPVPAGPHPSS